MGSTARYSDPSLLGCKFLGNRASWGGGLYHENQSHPTLVNTIFSGNTAEGNGGIDALAAGATLINCTLAGNVSNSWWPGGMGADPYPAQTTRITNCVFRGNRNEDGTGEAAQFAVLFDAELFVDYSSIQGWSGVFGGVGNFGDDALLVDLNGADGIAGTEDDDLRLSPGSPCADAGDNDIIPAGITTDLDGNPRRVDVASAPDTGNGLPPLVDIGAYELLDDCNGNGVPDEIDISGGASEDCNQNVIPDECEVDCNANDAPDSCDIDPSDPDGNGQTSLDCDANSVPDECEVHADCNLNGTPDPCDIDSSDPDGDGDVSADCNQNGAPDECELAGVQLHIEEDFDQGLPAGWTVDGIFQITGQCPVEPTCDGTKWAYAGDAGSCAYADNESGRLTLPPIALESAACQLDFCLELDSEFTYDFLRIYVNGTLLFETSGTTDGWEQRSIDLRAFNGQTVTITFEFESDQSASGYLGCQIDRIQVFSGGNDCNGNVAPDDCDIAAGTSRDGNMNGIPDECEVQPPLGEDGMGLTCAGDDDCDPPGSVCVESVCYVLKNRYISLDPNPANDGLLTARRVSLYDLRGLNFILGWAGQPIELAIAGPETTPQLLARIEDAPHYRDWSVDNFGQSWADATVHVGDCETSPGQTYLIEAIVEGMDINDQANYSAPLMLRTVNDFGDVVGESAGTPPEGTRSFKDISAVVRGFQSTQTEPKVWLDLQGPSGAPEIPDFSDINFADISLAVKGFQGEGYPFATPCDCPGQDCP